MKVIKKDPRKKLKSNTKIQNEFKLLLDVSHENILRYFEHFDGEMDVFECTFIITEYCHVRHIFLHISYFQNKENISILKKGDFRRIIYKAQRDGTYFEENQVLDWITQATNGLKHLHRLKIVHRDIKPE